MPDAATMSRVKRLGELPHRLLAQDSFSDAIASLGDGQAVTLDGVWGSSRALVAATLVRKSSGPLLVVCPDSNQIDAFLGDWSVFSPDAAVRFSALEPGPDDQFVYDEIYGERLRLVKALASDHPPRLIAASIQSLLQPVPDRQSLDGGTWQWRVAETVDRAVLIEQLARSGFHMTSAVQLPGEYSVRGGIIDVFAPDWQQPVRMELFDDQIESLRRFDASTQRSLESLDSIDVTLLAAGRQVGEHLAAFLPAGSWVLLIEPDELKKEGTEYLARLESPQDHHTVPACFESLMRFPSATAEGLASSSFETTCHLQIESVERFSGDIGKVRGELEEAGAGHDVFVVCETEAEAQRLAEIFADTSIQGQNRLHFPIGRLSKGFRLTSGPVVVISGAELFQRADYVRASRRRLGRTIDSFLSLQEGDLVVHLSHGIARYRGIRKLEKAGQVEEHLELQFDGNTRIYVPSSKIELVQKYVGGSRGKPKLAKIGGKTWVRRKEAAERAVTDLAADMIDVQAQRASRPGIAYPDDSAWQKEFDASFPYTETPDQLTAMQAIKKDMRRPKPMDRLLCGDVGFGKTEMAVRAAFKTIDSGYQVAVLVPTTILAEQHSRTFRDRLSEFPFEIATLSRFYSRKQQQGVLEGLAQGTVDIVIGTHRLTQRDIRFSNLGLVIIDEEQRFGVDVKERLKSLRQTVDVLTMTATPIPRTLHLSLMGVRSISSLETPPEDRLAVETRVTRFDENLVRHAVMREISRGGQVFFVHNRVGDIQNVAARLQRIVPEVRIGIAHGQMRETELEDAMVRFIDREYDMLLATTIVESGLDIPNANTIFIDDADRYGLADLHQLRGRVGRYSRRAYCYLLVDPKKHIRPEAARRLRAIEEFSQMGAGFAIAMRDLELRGAGNILGTEQSGHISAVGYELYCTLLDAAVRRLKQLPPKEAIDVSIDLPGEAYLPASYVPDLRTKIDLYRRLARVSSEQQLADLADELQDRFGGVTPEVEGLLAQARLRIWAHGWKIDSIHLEVGYAVLGYTARAEIERLARRSGGQLRVVDSQSAYLPLDKGVEGSGRVLGILESLLRPR